MPQWEAPGKQEYSLCHFETRSGPRKYSLCHNLVTVRVTLPDSRRRCREEVVYRGRCTLGSVPGPYIGLPPYSWVHHPASGVHGVSAAVVEGCRRAGITRLSKTCPFFTSQTGKAGQGCPEL